MPESEKENVKEVAQPSDGNAAQNSQIEDQKSSSESRPSSEDHNWKEVREIMQQQKQKIAELEEKLSTNKEPSESTEQDPLGSLSDDDIITVGDTKKIVTTLAEKAAARILEEKQKKQAIDQVPSQFGDYNEVIKLVDEYVKENPAAEAAILSSPNPRLTAYQMVKSSRMYHEKNSQKENAQKMIDNSKKPVSSQSVGTTSPLNEVGRYEKMTKEKAAEIRKIAEEYASRR